MRVLLSIVLVLVLIVVAAGDAGLIPNFYRTTRCREAEKLVRKVTWEKARNDSALGAKLLRLHYHDCFVRDIIGEPAGDLVHLCDILKDLTIFDDQFPEMFPGIAFSRFVNEGCDASILLDTVGTNQSEKDARPNLTLLGFEVIDEIKTRVEKKCPGIVSCADILALAARDAVSFPFKRPMWDVLTGRKDGRVSLLSDVSGNLPSPFSNFTTLLNLFSNKSLDIVDLVSLSGAHTIGVAHCGAFSRRLHNFTGIGDADPSLNPNYVTFLKTQCPNPANPATTVGMDPNSTLSFDSHYFTALNQKQGLFQSDAALLTNATSANIVKQFVSRGKFFKQFAKSMVKMGGIEVLVRDAGEIRKNCRVVN